MFQAMKTVVRVALLCVIAVVAGVAYLITMDTMNQSFREWYTRHVHWTD